MEVLRKHDVVLETSTSRGLALRLRPMTEGDWEVLHKWNSDPDVLYWSEEDDIECWQLEDMIGMYRMVSERAYCFIIEAEGKPIGECWLQQMNLEEISARFPDKDVRRMPIMIGEKDYWGSGAGTAVIRALTEFAFLREGADMMFACAIKGNNARCLRAFEKAGYVFHSKEESSSEKCDHNIHLFLTREMFEANRKRDSA
ncbi:GNAT family N-acetyltransferase [bacterium]|nr:GNAT family N-acetyltransferase [bacterium]